LAGRAIAQGDHLIWTQLQTGTARGGSSIWTDVTGSINLGLTDQYGAPGNGDTVSGAWRARSMDLSPMAGQHFVGAASGVDGYTTQGAWAASFNDLSYVAADGSVFPLYVKGQGSMSLCNQSAGMTGVTVGTEHVNGMAASYAQTTSYYHGDQIGSSRLISSGSGYPVWKGEYTPFGVEEDPQATTNHYKFTGKERDTETGLDYFGARYYGSNMGRWMSPDWSADPSPVPYAKLDDPQSLNLYAYVRNSPLSRADVDGHGWWSDFKERMGNWWKYGELVTNKQLPAAFARERAFLARHLRNPDGTQLTQPQLAALGRASNKDINGMYQRLDAIYSGSVSPDNAYQHLSDIPQNAEYTGPLFRLHSDGTIPKTSLEYWRGKTTEEIVESLKEGMKEPLMVTPEGVVMQGNTRIKVLEERGIDTSKLPKIEYIPE
jgi:RHS repeat-associated protein